MDTPSSNQLRIPGVPGDNLDPDLKPHAIPRGERHTVSGQLGLTVNDWRIFKRDGYDVPRLSDCDEFGVVGMPVLPQLLRYVVLPAGATVSTIEVEPGEPVIAPGPLNAYPVQPPCPLRLANLGPRRSGGPQTKASSHWLMCGAFIPRHWS